jgi:hypothetical protein
LASDGVSEGEFAAVEEFELGGMKGKFVLQSFMFMTDTPVAMLQEMNADIPITFVVVTKRQYVIAHSLSSADGSLAMSSSYPPTLVTETGQVIHPRELSSTAQL